MTDIDKIREEIRIELKEILDLAQEPGVSEGNIPFSEFWSRQFISSLHSKGLMITVEKELPNSKKADGTSKLATQYKRELKGWRYCIPLKE